jgi:predicted ATPase
MRPPGGENLIDLSQRVGEALDHHWPHIQGGRTVMVGHTGVIRVLLCRALGLPVSEALRFAPIPGSHTWLQLASAGAVLQTMGERPLATDPGIMAAARSTTERSTDRPPRIALSGSAGTGKSTLGRALAERLDVPYIPEGMRERLERGLDVHALGHDGFRALFFDLWEEQIAREDDAIEQHGGFVSDRSPWDFAAFRLIYRFTDDAEDVARFFETTRRRTTLLDRIIVLPWGVIPLQADGVRSSNPWTQRLFQATLEGLVSREVPDAQLAILPNLQGLEDRVGWVHDLLTESGTAMSRRFALPSTS